MPKYFLTAKFPTASSSTNKAVRFQVFGEEEQPPILAMERRRKPTQDKQQIERRVSHDCRPTTFSSKA
jgi:hypothetical protein